MFHPVEELYPPGCFSGNGESLEAGRGCSRRVAQPPRHPRDPLGLGLEAVPCPPRFQAGRAVSLGCGTAWKESRTLARIFS